MGKTEGGVIERTSHRIKLKLEDSYEEEKHMFNNYTPIIIGLWKKESGAAAGIFEMERFFLLHGGGPAL